MHNSIALKNIGAIIAQHNGAYKSGYGVYGTSYEYPFTVAIRNQ